MSFGDNINIDIITPDDTLTMSEDSVRLLNNIQKYNLVITGTIGAGKSTLCNLLETMFRINNITHTCYPEYLANDSLACELLAKRLSNKVSAVTFQNYILDYWKNALQKSNKGISIYERCVEDSVISFCNMANLNGDLTDQELLSLFERAREITVKYNGPSYFGTSEFIEIESTNSMNVALEILKIIQDDISNGIINRVIGLSVTDEVSFERVINRNREGESYSMSTIQKYNSQYRALYRKLKFDGKLSRFLDMGLFV